MGLDFERRFKKDGSSELFTKLESGKWHGPYSEDNIEVAVANSIVEILYVAPIVSVPTQEDINFIAKRELERIDQESIRELREFIVRKFVDDPDLPRALSDYEAVAKIEREKII